MADHRPELHGDHRRRHCARPLADQRADVRFILQAALGRRRSRGGVRLWTKLAGEFLERLAPGEQVGTRPIDPCEWDDADRPTTDAGRHAGYVGYLEIGELDQLFESHSIEGVHRARRVRPCYRLGQLLGNLEREGSVGLQQAQQIAEHVREESTHARERIG
jgi:hypothetical protein